METRRLFLPLSGVLLAGCVAQHEASEQREAVEYHQQQHDSALCAAQGLEPGSDAFRSCLAQLEGTAQARP